MPLLLAFYKSALCILGCNKISKNNFIIKIRFSTIFNMRLSNFALLQTSDLRQIICVDRRQEYKHTYFILV